MAKEGERTREGERKKENKKEKKEAIHLSLSIGREGNDTRKERCVYGWIKSW